MLSVLLKSGANPNAFIMPHNQTALGYSAWKGDVAAVDLLLSRGANIHTRSADGTTPITMAAHGEDHDSATLIAEKLIARGADVLAANNGGGTALHAAAAAGNERLVARLIKAGANVMASTSDGYRPLERAIERQKVGVIKQLLAAGAKVTEIQNACGATSTRSLAEATGNREIIELVRNHESRGI